MSRPVGAAGHLAREMDIKSRVLRQALSILPRRRAAAIVQACGLTTEEERCILEELE